MPVKGQLVPYIKHDLLEAIIAVIFHRSYIIDKSRRTLIWPDILGVKDSVVLSETYVIVALTKGMCAQPINRLKGL